MKEKKEISRRETGFILVQNWSKGNQLQLIVAELDFKMLMNFTLIMFLVVARPRIRRGDAFGFSKRIFSP